VQVLVGEVLRGNIDALEENGYLPEIAHAASFPCTAQIQSSLPVPATSCALRISDPRSTQWRCVYPSTESESP
jgi:hypothetical protein